MKTHLLKSALLLILIALFSILTNSTPLLAAQTQPATGATIAILSAPRATAMAIAAGSDHTCALTTSGGVKCWGTNYLGQLGDGTQTNRLTPVDVIGLTSGVTAITAGMDHTCALTTGGGVKCWGNNADGELGNGWVGPYCQAGWKCSTTPVDVVGLASGVNAIAAGYDRTCALMTSGGLKCWGFSFLGAIGDGLPGGYVYSTPININILTSGITAITIGWYHTCVLTTSGGVQCWGINNNGELGNGRIGDMCDDPNHICSLTPVNVTGLTSGVTAIKANQYFTCAITSSGGLKCWGLNSSGQLGDNTTTTRLTPVDVSGMSNGVAAVSMGQNSTCALKSSTGVKCWGDNSYGQIGDGTITNRLTPVDVSGLTSGGAAISVGSFASCALTTSRGVKCWGYNGTGQLGDGTTTQRLTPVDVVEFEGGTTYSITGSVKDSNNNSISGVTISDGVGHTATTDSSGNYTLSGLVPGTYTITPSKTGYTFSPTSRNVTVPPDATGKSFTGTVVSQRIPVIIVPGYFATWCVDVFHKCGWFTDKARLVYQPLIDAFTQAGYTYDQNQVQEPGEDLFVVFYDWTRPNTESANRLATKVNQAAQVSPTGKVNIVTHSNGANVARSYVQNNSPSKVDTLVLIAPPSKGVVRTYPTWEGGDTSQEEMLNMKVGQFSVPIDVALGILSPQLSWLSNPLVKYAAIHQFIPSEQELLPVGEDFLYFTDAYGNKDWQHPANMAIGNRNTFLENLNGNVQSLYNNVSKVVVMASTGYDTHSSIGARPHQFLDGVLWQDGKAESYDKSTQGDGTILLSRAQLPSCALPKCVLQQGYTLVHANLKGNDIVDEVRGKVLEAMGMTPPRGLVPVRAITEDTSDELIYTVSGPSAQLLIQDPNGRQIGYRPDGTFVNTIPGATYEQVTSEGKLVVVPNPLGGQYAVQVVALGSTSSYGGVSYSFVSGLMQINYTGTVNVGAPKTYTHNYTAASLYLPLIIR